ncbi:MAG TPA: AmmeMemoRadiSam system protein B [Candidatus Marinimicrobia bacterium]|nr:AmmeMemoRadiSam system protein B [Candidatus Neomarinimicrobiota bacterium]
MARESLVVRPAAVAGMFYPGTRSMLEAEIETYMSRSPDINVETERLYGIVSPHAGYVYSGVVAAVGYKLLRSHRFENVVVIAPSHREYFSGASVFDGDAYETPIGSVLVNRELCEFLVEEATMLSMSMSGHRDEHSLEVQLPFLQYIYGEGFKLVPVVVGEHSLKVVRDVAQALARASEEYEFVVVASSDLSHYHPYDVAVSIDSTLIKKLESYDLELLEDEFVENKLEACGIVPILSLMRYAAIRGNPTFRVLDYKNSGDTSSMKSQVVGYLSAVVYE